MQHQSQRQSQSNANTFAASPVVPALGYDEFRDATGAIRPHWQQFLLDAPDLQSAEFTRRWREAQQLIRENGVTYNVYGDQNGLLRPWRLDPLPLLLPQQEADQLERGLAQRARLFELVLADIYDAQRLLQAGLLPPELVFANPGFLRPCHGLTPIQNRYLHLYAANLGRDDAGKWVVLRDRTQAPSGAGYALENRIVVSRTLPEAFQSCRVQRIAAFFQTLLDSLRAIAPKNKENPRIVLLTPGPLNEAYFEHSYLARYLGITLAEGGDLTVRDRQVYLKVLGGLQQVDVIFRRLDDDYCDPLELKPDSFLGVPGLLQSIRSGHVAVANALGASAIESPAFAPFLPALARHLLGEELILESAPTWWCGDPAGLAHVLSNPLPMVLKSAFPGLAIPTVLLDECTAIEREQHLSRLKAQPGKYVAQQRMTLSTVPVFTENRSDQRRLMLRAFLTTDGEGHRMLPGGLTCFGSRIDSRSMSMTLGGGSKDTWVLSDGPVSHFTRLATSQQPLVLTRAGGDLPSRAADNLFWLGRYAERAEGAARLLRAALTRLLEQQTPSDHPEVPALLRAVVSHSKFPLTAEQQKGQNLETDVFPLVFDGQRPYSLASAVKEWHRVAGLVRDRISLDMWRVVSGVHRTVYLHETRAPTTTAGEVLDILDRCIVNLAAFGGLATESMTRSEGWRFLDLGRKLERSLNLTALLRSTLLVPLNPESHALDAILEVADSRMTYRRRYLNELRPQAVLDLVLLDESNPRSLLSLLLESRDDVDQLPRSTTNAMLGAEQRLALKAVAAVQLAEIERLVPVQDGLRTNLQALLDLVDEALPALSNILTLHYLSHLQITRHLAQSEGLAT